MAQAAYQAKAESEAGWDGASTMSGADSGRRSSQLPSYGANRGHVSGSMSMGNLGAFSSTAPMMPMGMPMMGYGGSMSPFAGSHVHPPQAVPSSMSSQQGYGPARGVKLPPFAPSFAMSQPMFQPSAYAESAAFGTRSGPSSAIGVGMGSAPSRQSPGPAPLSAHNRRAPASALGTGRR